MAAIVLIRGGGDLASGVALRLHRAGLRIAILELEQPLVVRRLAAFAEAVYAGEITVEGLTARRAASAEAAKDIIAAGDIPVLVDPHTTALSSFDPLILVDARMTKQPPDLSINAAELVIGLGPGFVASANCHAVVETMRGHSLGRVIWQGAALPNTGLPDTVSGRAAERVLRAPAAGILQAHAAIGDWLESGVLVASVSGQQVRAPFSGVLRGLLHPGLSVQPGMKIGDLDPRADPSYCSLVSDKALAIGGGVLEAILARPEIRARLWD